MHLPASSHGITFIMHQHTCVADIIGMEVLNLEVVDCNGCFEQLMLDHLNHYILAVALNENVACAQVDCIDPTLLRLIEWMRGRRGNSCSVVLQMHQFIRLVYIGLDDLFISAFSRLRVCSVDIISCLSDLEITRPHLNDPGYLRIVAQPKPCMHLPP